MNNFVRVASVVFLGCSLFSHAQGSSVSTELPKGVEKLCTLHFDKDGKRPARVEDQSLGCLNELAKALKSHPDRKLVLVGLSDPVKDHAELEKGEEREEEDMTGLDVRYSDIAMYRSENTKWYLVHFYAINPARIIPTTNDLRAAQEATSYLVPGDANFLNNYLGTTRTNENPCTVKPCYNPREESLAPQPRSRIQAKP